MPPTGGMKGLIKIIQWTLPTKKQTCPVQKPHGGVSEKPYE